MGLISAYCMWMRLSEDLSAALEQHANSPNRYCKTSEYMNLCFKVKWFYNTRIADVPELKNVVPAYPRFVPSNRITSGHLAYLRQNFN